MTQVSVIHSPCSYVSFSDLCLSASITEHFLLQLIENNIIAPVTGSQPQQWQFDIACVMQVKKATRLSLDLDIAWSDLAVVLNLLDEIEMLKCQNTQLKQQLSRFYLGS